MMIDGAKGTAAILSTGYPHETNEVATGDFHPLCFNSSRKQSGRFKIRAESKPITGFELGRWQEQVDFYATPNAG
jgi:hypothetical protein